MTIQMSRQVGGDHYTKMKIQPVEFIQANNIPFMEGSAIKYLARWRDKGGIQDLQKARHFIDMLIEYEINAQNRQSKESARSPATESFSKRYQDPVFSLPSDLDTSPLSRGRGRTPLATV